MTVTEKKPAAKKGGKDFGQLSPAQRQLKKNAKPVPPMKRYKVSLIEKGEEVRGEVNARNSADAWAFFCDERKKWPNIHSVDGTVEYLGELNDAD